MKVAQLPAPDPILGTGRYTQYILISHHAPTWPFTLQHLLQKIESIFYYFFSSILPKKEVPPPPKFPPVDVVKAIRLANAQKFHLGREIASAISEIFATAKQGIFPVAISWYQGKPDVLAAFFANKIADATSRTLERIANATLPYTYRYTNKIGSLAIAAPAVWTLSNYLGYPLGYMFIIGIVMNAASTVLRGQGQQPTL